MTDRELMQQALDALEGYARNCRCEGGGAPCDAAEALRARLAQPEQEHSEQWWKREVSNAWAEGYEKGRASIKQPEQEPVAWLYKKKDGMQVITDDPDYADGTWIPLYTAPPQREWQGLTEEDIAILWKATPQLVGVYSYTDIAREVEAKLKEKNA